MLNSERNNQVRIIKDQIVQLQKEVDKLESFWAPRIGDSCYFPYITADSATVQGIMYASNKLSYCMACKTKKDANDLKVAIMDFIVKYQDKKYCR